jgi:hypothetical protein
VLALVKLLSGTGCEVSSGASVGFGLTHCHRLDRGDRLPLSCDSKERDEEEEMEMESESTELS